MDLILSLFWEVSQASYSDYGMEAESFLTPAPQPTKKGRTADEAGSISESGDKTQSDVFEDAGNKPALLSPWKEQTKAEKG